MNAENILFSAIFAMPRAMDLKFSASIKSENNVDVFFFRFILAVIAIEDDGECRKQKFSDRCQVR